MRRGTWVAGEAVARGEVGTGERAVMTVARVRVRGGCRPRSYGLVAALGCGSEAQWRCGAPFKKRGTLHRCRCCDLVEVVGGRVCSAEGVTVEC